MRTKLITIFAGVLMTLSACNNRSIKQSGNTDSMRAVAPRDKEDANPNAVYDPDPSDTVPGDRYPIRATSKKVADMVSLTLQSSFKDDLGKNIIDDASRKFIIFEYDLNDDARNEIFVGLIGSYFCGSGGCTILVLDNQGKIITKFTVAGYPVIIDTNKTKGWKDLFIQSGGKNHIMKFDGQKYPSNPSVQPELKIMPGDGLPRALNFINEPYPWFKF